MILAYNGERYLADAIESVLGQTRVPDEIIVVDNGSIDRTAEIAGSFPLVRCVSLRENIGSTRGYNRGAELATGDYLAFLDYDDIWLPEKTERQLALILGRPEVAVVSGRMIWWDVSTDTMSDQGYAGPEREGLPRSLVFRNHVGNMSITMIRRSVFLDHGGMDPTHPWADDWDLWLRMAGTHEFRFVDVPVIRYRWHSGNLSHHRRRESMRANELVAVHGMRRLLPRRQWPAARLRIRSWHELQLSHVAADEGKRWESWWRAVMALLLFPAADARTKIGNIWRSMAGIGFE